jgi:hypothetical protein
MPRIKISKQEAELRYTNWISMLIDLIKPKNLYLFGGRGVAKSSDIIAKRAIDIIYDMPRGSFAFVADSYVHLLTNIIPAVMSGWENRMGFHEWDESMKFGHFCIDREPPRSWPQPYIKTFEFKHTITTFNGCKFFMTSLDRPSSNAGISVVHIFGDEAKYLKQEKLNKLFPALRGDYRLFGHSHYFMGQTFCSDMADPNNLEYDWMLQMEKNMDRRQILRILQTAIVLNEISYELFLAERSGAGDQKIENIKRNQAKWVERIRKIRHNSTFFHVVSTLANIDILTFDYLVNNLQTLGWEEFKTVILSIRKTLESGARFYGALGDSHFYDDGYNYDFYDQFSLKSNITQTSEGLRYIQHDRLLEAGFDAGNMMSMVFGQEQGREYRVLKNMYVITPEWIRELADQFLLFFAPHRRKILQLYYDRAANQYHKSKRDFATQLKHDIEYDRQGRRTGWMVQLMSIGQRNITHAEEFNLMNVLMGEKDKRLPHLLVDKFECKELKSQLECTPVEKGSNGEIKKVKKGDKLPASRLPLESTNLSDAFKYLLCRPKYLAIAKQKRPLALASMVAK